MRALRRSWLWLLLVPGVALGSQIVKRSLAERARLADRVVLAQVLSSRTVAQGGNPRALITLTEVLVGENLKGQGPERLTILQRGGALGLREVHVPGDARLVNGETALLLLRCPEAAVCVLTALGEAKVGVQGADALLLDLATHKVTRRPLNEVLSEVRAAVAPAPAPTPAPKTGVAK
jgi:hypothetical protein